MLELRPERGTQQKEAEAKGGRWAPLEIPAAALSHSEGEERAGCVGEEGCSVTPASARRAKKSRGTKLERKMLKAAFELQAGMQTSVSCIPGL